MFCSSLLYWNMSVSGEAQTIHIPEGDEFPAMIFILLAKFVITIGGSGRVIFDNGTRLFWTSVNSMTFLGTSVNSAALLST